ncbi:MAG: hypothetical protein DBX58_02110 [Clostridiales bacterium]|nr:MAG: hypothetical protein DBX58_02110 [Clostridiales bacterium]HJA30673.1 ABC-2 transporter permease [Candidatus Eisenbergiella pullicola]
MRGLLRKDWYMTLRYGKFFLAFVLIYAVIAAFSEMGMLFSLINVMIGGMLVKTLISYEEQSKWDSMAVYLPVTAECIVAEKYVVGLISVALTSLLTAGTIAAACSLSGRGAVLPFGSHVLLLMGAGTLWLALEMPVLFKFGVNKGRIWFALLTALIAGLIGGAGMAGTGRFGEGLGQTGLSAPALTGSMAAFLAAAAALIALSIRLSVHFFRKREF